MHRSKTDLKNFLREREFYTDDRWDALKMLGVDTMERLAHAAAGGDVQEPQTAENKRALIKNIEGEGRF